MNLADRRVCSVLRGEGNLAAVNRRDGWEEFALQIRDSLTYLRVRRSQQRSGDFRQNTLVDRASELGKLFRVTEKNAERGKDLTKMS